MFLVDICLFRGIDSNMMCMSLGNTSFNNNTGFVKKKWQIP